MFNWDFFIANYSSDEEAQEYLSRGTKEYSVLIEPELLEEMAKDAETKEKYFGIIEDGTRQLDKIKEDLKEFLDLVDYKYSCDKSGFAIIEETNTIFLFGIPLIKLYTEI